MNDPTPSLNKPQHEKSLRKPYAGNLHVRFDEEEGAARPPLLTLLSLCFKPRLSLLSNRLVPSINYDFKRRTKLGCPHVLMIKLLSNH
jgi:hypothetical protein